MANLGQTWFDVVEHGLLRVDVGQLGRTGVTYGRCGLTSYNIANLGQTWVDVVEHG